MARYLGMLAAVLLAGGVDGCDRSLRVVYPRNLPAGTIVPCGEVYLGTPLEFIAGGKYLVVGDRFAPYAVDVETGAPVPGPSGRVVAVSRSGLVVFDETYSMETELRRPPWRQMGLWDLSDRPPRLVRRWSASPNDWRCALSPDGKHLAFLKNERVWLCDAADGSSARQVMEEAGTPLAFSLDGSILACLVRMPEGRRSGIALWNLAEGRLRHTLDPSAGYDQAGLGTVVFSADGRTLVVRHRYYPPGPQEHEIRTVAETVVCDVAGGDELLRTSGGAAVTGDRRFLLHPGEPGAGISVFDLSTGIEARRLESGWPGAFAPGTPLYAARVPSPSSSDRTNAIAQWNVATGARLKTLPPVEDWWECTALSPDRRLVVLSTVSRMRVADFATGRTILEVYKPPRGETGVSIGRIALFSPDAKHLAFNVGSQGFIAYLDAIRAAGS
ncbi:MAG TPA: hypothetical protein VM238_07855 [Phycisphaerae bacterium]|nr:hypothetical protein [Phycisphaerae bacterium]